MAKWVQLQLNRGKFVDREGRLFSEQRSREMWAPQTILPVNDPPPAFAGLADTDKASGEAAVRDETHETRTQRQRRRGCPNAVV